MVRYRVLFKRSVGKDLRDIPKKDVQRILKRIKSLADEPRPHGCEKLTDQDQERYRIRQSSYRILYEIQDEALVVVIVKVAKRGEAYG
jgi:mRNA interferase RelE/StbE